MCSSGNGRGTGIERLLREADHDGRIFSNGIQHHRALEFGSDDFPQNVDALGLQGP